MQKLNTQRIQRTIHSRGPFIQNVSINHGGLNTGMIEQFLNGSYIIAIFQKMSCKTVSECMNTAVFGYFGIADGSLDGTL